MSTKLFRYMCGFMVKPFSLDGLRNRNRIRGSRIDFETNNYFPIYVVHITIMTSNSISKSLFFTLAIESGMHFLQMSRSNKIHIKALAKIK